MTKKEADVGALDGSVVTSRVLHSHMHVYLLLQTTRDVRATAGILGSAPSVHLSKPHY